MFRKTAVFLIFLASFLSAHKLNIFVYDEDNTLYIQSYFTKSSPCKNCEVVVEDDSGDTLAKLFTDGEGKASLSVSKDVVAISVDGGMGHFQKLRYELKSRAKEEAQNLPADISWQRIVLGLGIIAAVFLILWFVKRKR